MGSRIAISHVTSQGLGHGLLFVSPMIELVFMNSQGLGACLIVSHKFV